MEAARPFYSTRALNAFKLGNLTFYWITRVFGDFGAAGSRRHHCVADRRGLARDAGIWIFIPAGRQRWAPSADPPVLGALGPIYGTLVTSGIAMAIAIPVGLGIAIFLTELCPQWLRASDRHGGGIARRHSLDHLRHVGLLPARPRFWPITFEPWMISTLRECSRCSEPIFGGPPSYLSLFNAALDPCHHGAAVYHRDFESTCSRRCRRS